MGRGPSVRVKQPEQGARVIQLTGRRHRHLPAPRVGLFGKIGAWNTGNDASMESVLAYLGSGHAEAVIDAMCTGPERVTELTASLPSRCSGNRGTRSGCLVLRALRSRGSGRASMRSERRHGSGATRS